MAVAHAPTRHCSYRNIVHLRQLKTGPPEKPLSAYALVVKMAACSMDVTMPFVNLSLLPEEKPDT
eukprot:gene11817-15_t